MDTLHFGTAIGCTSRIVIIHIFQHGKGIVSIVFAVVNIAVAFAFVQVFAAFTAKTFAIFPAQDLRRRRKHDAVVDDGIEINNFVVVGKRILVRGILKKSFFHGDFIFHRSGRAAAVAIENRFRGEYAVYGKGVFGKVYQPFKVAGDKNLPPLLPVRESSRGIDSSTL